MVSLAEYAAGSTTVNHTKRWFEANPEILEEARQFMGKVPTMTIIRWLINEKGCPGARTSITRHLTGEI